MSDAHALDVALERRLRDAIGPHLAADVDPEQQLQSVLGLLAEGRSLNRALLGRVLEIAGGEADG